MTANVGTPITIPTKPNNPPPSKIDVTTQNADSPVEFPRIFGPRIFPSNCCKTKINIRKYRKTDKKIQRTKKPDYIAEEIIKTNQGIINEKVVYENEIKRLMEAEAKEQVRKMEEFFENKKENEGFDILSFELNEDGEYVEKYIEVKSTKGNEGTPIDITADEIDFAKKHIDNYYLYRIINSESKDRYLKIVKGRDLFNNDDYNFIPMSYKIYSN